MPAERLLLDHGHKVRRCAVGEHNCLAAERAHLGAADVEHIGQAGHIGQRHIGALGGQTIAQTGTVHKQRHMVLMADSGQRFQLCLGVQGAVLRRVGDVHHAREHEVVHIAIGIEGPAPVLNRPGIQLAVGVRQADDLVARELNGTGLVGSHMAGGCGQHTLQRRSIDAMTMALLWVPPEMNQTSASGAPHAARIFSRALAQ